MLTTRHNFIYGLSVYFEVIVPDKVNILTVGLQKILSLLEAEDADVRIHAVKVVANLAAEGCPLICLC